MHELSAACSIVETALEAAKGHKVRKITAVNVDVGEFTFLVPQQLEFNFEIASKNTILEGAKLNMNHVKGKLKCHECGYEGKSFSDLDLPPQIAVFSPMKCPKCSSSDTEIIGGKEFFITNIEAEVEEST